MIERERDGGIHLLDFSPVLVANSLPFAGIALSDAVFTVDRVFLLFWFEMVALFLVYCGCALFAQQNTTTDGEEWGSDESALANLPDIRVHRSLPAVRLRNLRVVVPMISIIGFLLTGVGDWVISSNEAYGAFPSWLSEFTRPAMFASALAIVASHLVYVSRNFFRPRRYRVMSPQTTLDTPIRLLLLFIPATVAWIVSFVLVGGFLLNVFSRPAAEIVGGFVLCGGFFLLKIGIEWARFRAEHADEPGGLAAWLVPANPRSGSQD